MPTGVLDLHFMVNLAHPLVIILEPSHLKDGWDKIYNMADGLIQMLPGRVSQLYFLGHRRHYPMSVNFPILPRTFRENIPCWYRENKGRVSCLGPILEGLEEDMEKKPFKGMAAVICHRLPVDIDDWVDTEIMERLLLVMVSEEPWDESLGLKKNVIDGRHGPDQVIKALENTAEEAFVEGKGFIPLCHDKGEVEYQDGGFKLRVPVQGETRLDFHLRALGDFEVERPRLQIKRVRGSIEKIEGQEEQPWFPEPEWQTIPQELLPVVEAGILGKPYHCPRCGEKHSHELFLCPQGDIVLKGIPLNTCILFRREKNLIKYLILSDGFIFAYPLRKNHRVITMDGMLYDLYNYESDGQGWRGIRNITPYEEVEEGIWAVFHCI